MKASSPYFALTSKTLLGAKQCVCVCVYEGLCCVAAAIELLISNLIKVASQ